VVVVVVAGEPLIKERRQGSNPPSPPCDVSDIALPLAAVSGVEGVFGEDFAGVSGADDGVGVVDEADDLGPGGGSADAEVEQASGVAKADLPVLVDGVLADSPDVGVVGLGGGALSG
jgi:hypothetical protein